MVIAKGLNSRTVIVPTTPLSVKKRQGTPQRTCIHPRSLAFTNTTWKQEYLKTNIPQKFSKPKSQSEFFQSQPSFKQESKAMRRDLELIGLLFTVISSENYHWHQQLKQTTAHHHLDLSSESKASCTKDMAPLRGKSIRSKRRQSQTLWIIIRGHSSSNPGSDANSPRRGTSQWVSPLWKSYLTYFFHDAWRITVHKAIWRLKML